MENNLYQYFLQQNPKYKLSFAQWAEDFFANRLTKEYRINLYDQQAAAISFWSNSGKYLVKYGKTADEKELIKQIEKIAPSILVTHLVPIWQNLIYCYQHYNENPAHLDKEFLANVEIKKNAEQFIKLMETKPKFDFENTAFTSDVDFVLFYDEIKIELIHTSADGIINNESVTTEFDSRVQDAKSDIYYKERRLAKVADEQYFARSKVIDKDGYYQQEPVRVKSKKQYTLASISIDDYMETIQEIVEKNLSQNAYEFLRRSGVKLTADKTYKITYRYECEKTMRIFLDQKQVKMILCSSENINQNVYIELPENKKVKKIIYNKIYLDIDVANNYEISENFNDKTKVITGECQLEINLLKPILTEKDLEIYIETKPWDN